MTKRSLVLSLVLSLALVGCSTEIDDLLISDEQKNRMAALYDQANAQLDTDTTKAIQTARQMLESAEIIEYKTGIGDAHHLLGLAYDFQGKYDSSAHHHLIALRQRQELNDEKKKGKSYVNLGILYWHLGLLKEARDCHEAAIAIWEELGNVQSEANAYYNLGLIEQDAKNWSEAAKAYQHSLHLHQKLDNQATVAKLYNNLAIINESKEDQPKDDRKILGYYKKALQIVQSSNDGYAIGWINCNIGRTYNTLNKADSALLFLSKAQDHLDLLPGEKQSLVVVYNSMAEAYQRKKEWKQAIQVLEKAERIENQVTGKFKEVYQDTYQLFQDIYAAQRNTAQVKHYQRKYQAIQSELAYIKEQAEIVQLRTQVQVKDLQNFLSWQRQHYLEGMNSFMKMILVPVCLLLVVVIWLYIKQSKMKRIYETVIMNGMPHFDFDERKKKKTDEKDE